MPRVCLWNNSGKIAKAFVLERKGKSVFGSSNLRKFIIQSSCIDILSRGKHSLVLLFIKPLCKLVFTKIIESMTCLGRLHSLLDRLQFATSLFIFYMSVVCKYVQAPALRNKGLCLKTLNPKLRSSVNNEL